MAEVTYIPDNNNGQANNILPWMLAANNGGFGGWNNGLFGGSGIGAFIGALFGSALSNWWGGNGGFGGFGGNAGVAALGAQATANNNADTILRAIDGTDSDVRLLATTLNSDINSVKSNLSDLSVGLTALSGQTGLSAQQILNGIMMGDANLSRQLCECCCENRLLTTQQGYESRIQNMQQTESFGNAINIQGQRNVDAIADLKTTMVQEFCNVKEREMQDKINTQSDIITQLRGQIDNANQTAAITGYINSVVAPMQRDIDKIRENQPNTVPVQWPQLQAVNTTPYVSGGYYGMNPGWGGNFGWGNGFFGGFGNGFGGNIVF